MTLPAFDFKAVLQEKKKIFCENCDGCDELVTGLHIFQFGL